MKWLSIARDTRGQALIELALCLTLLLTIMLGIVEFGRIGHAYLVTTHASREGARVGALRYSDDEIYLAVDRALLSLGNISIQVTVTPSDSVRKRGDALEVTVNARLPLITPLAGVLPNPFSIVGRTVMRVE